MLVGTSVNTSFDCSALSRLLTKQLMDHSFSQMIHRCEFGLLCNHTWDAVYLSFVFGLRGGFFFKVVPLNSTKTDFMS